jgi:hypothetical protein
MKDGEALCPGHADATATPQPSAPVVACKAPTWCGFKADSNTDERRATWLAISPKPKIFGGLLVGSPAFCSPGCFERQVPPLAAKPAEAKRQPCCIHAEDSDFDEHDDDCHAAANAQTAEQPKPAAKGHDFSDPYCARRYKGDVVRLCVACGAFDKDGMRSPKCDPTDGWRKGYEGWVGEAAQSGKPYLGPERLPRPRLAHSMGIEDPTLPEAR